MASSLRVVGTSRERGAEESRERSAGLKLSTEAESTMSTGSWAARWNRGESGTWRSRVETLSWQKRSAWGGEGGGAQCMPHSPNVTHHCYATRLRSSMQCFELKSTIL